MNPRRQQGVSLVTAIFLLVVFTALGTYMLTVSNVQHYTYTYAVQGARAYHAARTGIEWGTHQVVGGGGCFGSPTTFTLDAGGLSGYRVTVDCTSTSHQEKETTFRVYTLTADAETAAPVYGEPGYARRIVTATITDATQ